MATNRDFVVKNGLIVTDDITLDDGGSLKEAGGTAAITFDGSGNITKIGQDSPSSGEFLKWDGSKWVADAVSAGASAIDDLSDAITDASNNIGLGSNALDSLTAGSGINNTALGIDAGTAITTGDRNTAVGFDAGDSITTGSKNVAIGSNALDGSTTGSEDDNVAIGYQAIGGPLNGGENNVAIGSLVGDAITSASQCTLVGYHSGSAITTGNFNTAVGATSLFSVTTGTNNTAVGYEAGYGFDTESHNVAVGYRAFRQQSGTHSVAIGAFSQYGAGAANVGDYNVSVGGYSLEKITSGDNNVVMGYEAGELITTGSSNLLLGHTAGDNITTGSGNVIIGNFSADSATGNDQLIIGSGDGSATWLKGDSNGLVAHKISVVAVTTATTLTDAQSGSYVYVTGSGAPTLPATAEVGQQYTIINNTGSDLTPALGTSNSSIPSSHTAISDDSARTYVCVAANTWFFVG